MGGGVTSDMASMRSRNADTGSWETVAEPLGVRDNVPAPSQLIFDTHSSDNYTVEGTLTWNVSRGWEGYAYRVCVTARHVPVQAGAAAERLFGRRCVYVIVSKCLRCFSGADTLDGISRLYGDIYILFIGIKYAVSTVMG